jgi:dephospho-CoA kinase
MVKNQVRKVIGFVGMPGSGKSTALNVAKKYGPIIIMGDVVRDETTKRGLAITSENLGAVAKKLREENGPDVIALRCIDKIQLLKDKIIFIDGIRCPTEVAFFRKSFPIIVVAVDAPDESRHKWIMARGRADDSTLLATIKQRDERELGFGLKKVIEKADHKIINSGSIELLEKSCETLITKILNQ